MKFVLGKEWKRCWLISIFLVIILYIVLKCVLNKYWHSLFNEGMYSLSTKKVIVCLLRKVFLVHQRIYWSLINKQYHKSLVTLALGSSHIGGGFGPRVLPHEERHDSSLSERNQFVWVCGRKVVYLSF